MASSYAISPGVFMPRPKNPVPTDSHDRPSGQADVRIPDRAGGRRVVYLAR